MQQAAPVFTLMPDTMSSGIFRSITGTLDERVDDLHSRLFRMRGMISLVRDLTFADGRIDDLLACMEDQIDACLMLSGDEARVIGVSPVGFDQVWSRPSYRAARAEGRI